MHKDDPDAQKVDAVVAPWMKSCLSRSTLHSSPCSWAHGQSGRDKPRRSHTRIWDWMSSCSEITQQFLLDIYMATT